jgi:hypothetical protein
MRKIFEHNMEVYNRGGSPDEYIDAPAIPQSERVLSLSDFIGVRGLGEGLIDLLGIE